MEPDSEGFLYPCINSDVCAECGLCIKVCAFQNGYSTPINLSIPRAYAVKHKDFDTRLNSRSGGVFTAITDIIFKSGGVVYGVGYRGRFVACHKKATNKYERDEFRGSKYVQSELGNVYKEIKKDLLSGKTVLFSGTTCQTSGLKSYLGKSHHNLVLCDLICHGAPSPLVWHDYLSYIEKKYKGTVSNVDFRNKKKFGWAAHYETITVNEKECDSRIFTNLFYHNACLRPSCYHCKYTNTRRPSDVTLADFWGIDDIVPDFSDNKGISLILINTEKGMEMFEKAKIDIDFVECTGREFIHPNLKKPTAKPVDRERFWLDYQRKGFGYIAKKYADYGLIGNTKRSIKYILKRLGLNYYY